MTDNEADQEIETIIKIKNFIEENFYSWILIDFVKFGNFFRESDLFDSTNKIRNIFSSFQFQIKNFN